GAFRFKVDTESLIFRFLEYFVNGRSRLLGLPYGDQGFFIKAEKFWQLGGFKNLPIMEDYEFVQRVKQEGKIGIANSSVKTSARRWQKLGLVKTTLINQLIILGYYLKIPPEHLARWYRNFPSTGAAQNIDRKN
ncbi:MAG: TIGR04283 family arsenosugar biosynthesis glycosyltransferase, partial [Microcystaceae cyanobacterium]